MQGALEGFVRATLSRHSLLMMAGAASAMFAAQSALAEERTKPTRDETEAAAAEADWAGDDTIIIADYRISKANAVPVPSALPVLALTDSSEAEGRSQTAPQPAPPAAASPKSKADPVKLVVSQYIDTIASGSADGAARYSGRADAYINLPGSSFGLDDSWTLKVRPEFRWGVDSNGLVGLIPNNTALFRPEGSENFDLSLSVKKTWQSGANLEVGKINILDKSGALPIVASDGHFGFQNLGIALPPTAVLPNTLTGAMLEVPTKKVIYRLWVFDPDSQYNRTGFETAFEGGVGFLASAAALTRFGGKPGVYNFAVVGSTRSGPATDILPTALTPPPGGNFGDGKGELALQLSGFQYLSLNKKARGKGIGIFARFQASLGDPTFLDYSGFVGISGNPANRPQDRFGFSIFQYSLTDELVEDLAPFLPLGDERGVEAFYTVGFSQGFEFTMNAQWVDSAIAFREDGVLVGARLTKVF
ncbi:MAG: carbohydrate porin [Erythrobacter sp.]